MSVLILTPGLGRHNRGSFFNVANSLTTGLTRLGIDARQWDAPPDPEDAHEALPDLRGVTHLVWVGPPLFALWAHMLMTICAQQRIRTYWMLAANSTTLPDNALAFAKWHPWTKILTPSDWGRRVIRSVDSDLPPVLVVPHGVEVDPEQVPVTERTEWAHAVAGATGRKGTEELLEAVQDDIPLAIYADVIAYGWLSPRLVGRKNVRLVRAYNADEHPAWWHHLRIAHPSRAEGFGLSLVEAVLLRRCVLGRKNTGVPARIPLVYSPDMFAGDAVPADAWEVWAGGDGDRQHLLGRDVTELTIAPPAALRLLLRDMSTWEWVPLPSERAEAFREEMRHDVAVRPLADEIRGGTT